MVRAQGSHCQFPFRVGEVRSYEPCGADGKKKRERERTGIRWSEIQSEQRGLTMGSEMLWATRGGDTWLQLW